MADTNPRPALNTNLWFPSNEDWNMKEILARDNNMATVVTVCNCLISRGSIVSVIPPFNEFSILWEFLDFTAFPCKTHTQEPCAGL